MKEELIIFKAYLVTLNIATNGPNLASGGDGSSTSVDLELSNPPFTRASVCTLEKPVKNGLGGIFLISGIFPMLLPYDIRIDPV